MTKIWKRQSDWWLPGVRDGGENGWKGRRCNYKRATGEDCCSIGTVQHLDCIGGYTILHR